MTQPKRKPRKPTQPKMLELYAERCDWGEGDREIQLSVPIKLVSEANQREHWAAKHRRKTEQQETMALVLPMAGKLLRALGAPIKKVELVRFGRKMDKDNNTGSFKHVQDAIAKWLGADDGDLDFVYAQAGAGGIGYGVVVTFICEPQT